MKNKRIGIVGGGQLGRMLAYAAKKHGFYVTVLDPTPQSPASHLADAQIVKSFKDSEGIKEIANISDFITFEIESANAEALEELLNNGHIINPSPQTLTIIKDKFGQKNFLESHDIPVAESIAIESKEDFISAAKKFGYPILLKSRFDAYDGRGNALIEDESEVSGALNKLKGKGRLYVEKFVPFVKELSVLVARGMNGEIVNYPTVETIHKNNICHMVLSPAPVSLEISDKAEKLAKDIMKHLKGVGVFAVEMFLTEDGQILVNEIAPRVHNSGHHTIEANKTSQFEQHIRAITGLPLGETEMIVPYSVMINILGERTGSAKFEGKEQALEIPGTSVHIYGKVETRPERKMGHITIIDSDLDKAIEKAKKARKYISI